MSILVRFLFAVQLTVFSVSSFANTQVLNLGVYAYQSPENVEQEFKPLAEFITQKIPHVRVVVKPLNAVQMREAVRAGELQLMLLNPVLYEIIRHESFLTGITATLVRQEQGVATSSLGGVIFTQADNTQFTDLSSFKGARVAVPHTNNTGAYRIPLMTLLEANVKASTLTFSEVGTNDAVVQDVLSGTVDAGFIRTGVLEAALQKDPSLFSKIHIVNQQNLKSFPFVTSTRLYPEWPFLISPTVNHELSNQIASALYQISPKQAAFNNTSIAGFTAPLDYKVVEELLRALKAEPYDQQPAITWHGIWQQHPLAVVLSLSLFISLLIIGWIIESNRRKAHHDQLALEYQNQLDDILLTLPTFFGSMSEAELMQVAMEKLESLTESKIGFIHFFDEQSNEIQLVTWSHNTLETYCHMHNYETHYPFEKAGVWADAAREKQPVLINDYAQYPNKNGLPDGHAALHRMVSVPVIDSGKVTVLAGIGNKLSDYTQKDVDSVQLVCNELWRLIKDRRIQGEIARQKDKYERLLNDLSADHVVFSHDGLAGCLNYVSAGYEVLFEQPVELVLNKPWFEHIDWLGGSVQQGASAVKELINNADSPIHQSFYLEFKAPISGEEKKILVQQHGVYLDSKLISVDGLVSDVTQRFKTEQKLRQAASVFEAANEGIMITDSDNRILQVNHQFECITGYATEEVMGRDPSFLSSGRQDSLFYEKLWQDLLENGSWEGEIWNRRKSGEVYPERLKIAVVRNEANQVERFIALMADITFEKNHEASLKKMAHYDALTRLPNRFLLTDRINQALALSHRNHSTLAIMFIDLDGFKQVNDHFGHPAGDYLLTVIAERFQKLLREVDTVARIGGDEFVVLLVDQHAQEEIQQIECRLLASSSTPVIYEGHELKVSSSIGSVYYDESVHSANLGSEKLIRLADQAMYQAKQLGKNRFYHHQWHQSLQEQPITQAIENHELELFYQPKIDFKHQEVHSLEGLIRWQHPEKGLLLPAEFLDGLRTINDHLLLGDYVIREGLRFLTQLNSRGLKLDLSLNITGEYLEHEAFIEKVDTLLAGFPQVSPEQLIFEVLESSALGDVEVVVSAIKQAQARGIRFSIDDFGTGHASLSYLKNLPVEEVKIDQDFVRDIFSHPNSLSIIDAIHSMAEAFEMHVVAEGVETEEHIELMMQMGIYILQGYAISKPLSATKTLEWLSKLEKHSREWGWDGSLHSWGDYVPEISSTAKQILKGKLAHQVWVSQIQAHLLDNVPLVDFEISPAKCVFGKWLNKKGRDNMLSSNLLIQIEFKHAEVHNLVKRALELKPLEDSEEMIEEAAANILSLQEQLTDLLDRAIAEQKASQTW